MVTFADSSISVLSHGGALATCWFQNMPQSKAMKAEILVLISTRLFIASFSNKGGLGLFVLIVVGACAYEAA